MTAKTALPLRLMAGVVTLGLLAGCTSLYSGAIPEPDRGVADMDLVGNSYQAAEGLLRGLQQPLDKEKPVLVATLVNVADMRQSSDLGRIIAEQVASRLTQLGYQTKELKFRGSFLVRQGGGEFVLSRALRDISRQQDAQAVVAGVYAVARDDVYITLRVIRASDSAVLASYDYQLPLGPDASALLGRVDKVVQF
jgi:TolB-like protein